MLTSQQFYDLNDNSKQIIRLPNHCLPLNYDIKIISDLEKFIFNGEVTIAIDFVERSDYLMLHSKNLNLITINFSARNSTKIDTKIIHTRDDIVLIQFPEISPGTYFLKIKYEG